jgi:hypothetical protein
MLWGLTGSPHFDLAHPTGASRKTEQQELALMLLALPLAHSGCYCFCVPREHLIASWSKISLMKKMTKKLKIGKMSSNAFAVVGMFHFLGSCAKICKF